MKFNYFDLEISTKEIITVGFILGCFGLGICFRDMTKGNKKRNHKKKELI